MRKSPGFTAVAVFSLALGIGANTAIFTFVDAALLRPLPYPDADRIAVILQRPIAGQSTTLVHPRSFVAWEEQAKSFDALSLAQPIPVNTSGPGGAEQIAGLWATASLFDVFNVAPMLGRTFGTDEGSDRASVRGDSIRSAAILSHGYWQRRFGGDRNALGAKVPIGRGTATVIGVMPADFKVGTLDVDIYLPLPLERSKPEAVGSRSFLCFARLRDGVTLAAAVAEMNVIAANVARQVPGEKDFGVAVFGVREYLVRDHRRILLVLAGAVAFVLLIACANLAGLLLTRGVERRRELAVRASLGATQLELIQQLIVESLALAFIGGALGIVAASWTTNVLRHLARDAVALGQLTDGHLDVRGFAFTLVLSIAAALVCGLAPAWRSVRLDLLATLKQHGAPGSDSRDQQRLRAVLVAGQVAVCVVLLVGAGLLLRTFANLMAVDVGFGIQNALTMRMLVTGDAARRSNLVNSLLDRVETLPGVEAVGTIQFLPLSGWTNNGPFHFVGRPRPADPNSMETDRSTVSHGYFEAMGIPLVAGRPFERRDAVDSPRVAVVNDAFVRKYSRDENPIGRFILGDWTDPKPTEIVGVVGDVRHNGLTSEPRPTIFLAQSQAPGYITYLIVRTPASAEQMASMVRSELRQVDPSLPITDIQPLEHYVSRALARPRFLAVLTWSFASMALVLAAVGLYGLMAYTVSRRAREIGIRVALGARPADVLRSTLAQSGRLLSAGLAVGLAGSLALSGVLANTLFGVGERDPLTYAAALLVLAAAALLATYAPARRASRMDPIVALRLE